MTRSDLARSFSHDYATARARFRETARNVGFELAQYSIGLTGPGGEELTLDVARKGTLAPQKTLVISSATHGVEGFFGSAVQRAALDGLLRERRLPKHLAVVLIHAINPYGFAHLRRVNEDNIDLNRNFLLEGRAFAGAPEAYRRLDTLLNPRSAPRLLEPFWAKAGLELARVGFSALKNAVAQGQYEYPAGLFFGGKAQSRSQRILAEHAGSWIGSPERVLHLDLHTGLGKWARYTLGTHLSITDPRVAQLEREFGREYVQGFDPRGTLYEIQGGLGRWLEQRFARTQYDCLLAEFGTYPVLRVLSAMRRENCAHLYAQRNARVVRRAQRQLLEVFCPKAPTWRRKVVERGLRIVDEAFVALS